MSIHWCQKTIRTSHPSGSRRNTSFVFLPLVPWYPSQSSVPNRVQKVFTESVAQLALSRPEKAHGLGETSNTMGDRSVQSDQLVQPLPNLAHFCRPNLTRKHSLSLIRRLVRQHHPGCSGELSGDRTECNDAIGFGFFTLIKALC